MVDKYEIRLRCNDESVVVTVHSDGILELEGYDESYDQAAQEFGYEQSRCSDLVRLWRDEDVAANKVFAIFTILMPTAAHAVRLAAEVVRYMMRLLPDYTRMDPPSSALHHIKLDAAKAVGQIVDALEWNRRLKPTIAPPSSSRAHSNYFYAMEAHADKFLGWAHRNRRVMDGLRSDEEDSSRPATTSFLEAVGYLCRGAMFVDDPSSDGPELKEVILNDMFQSTNRALWGITFSKNKRRGSDYSNTVDWFIGRFVKFMKERP